MHIQDEKTLEVARRTRANLQFMDEQYHLGAEVYEFTQLFNSMLGMVICVREDYFKVPSGSREPAVRWDDLTRAGLVVSGDLRRKAHAFSSLISGLRNAFAHNNYDFIVDLQTREITGVRVWNQRGEEKTWQSTLLEKDLREVANLAIDYLERRLTYGAPDLSD